MILSMIFGSSIKEMILIWPPQDDLAVDVKTCMMPAEDLLHQSKADELFPNQQGEDLMGEKFLDNLVMEAGDMVESAIRGCASFLPSRFR